MRVTITGINFTYDNGYDQDYTGVELHYIVSGIRILNSDPVEITSQEYEDNSANANGLRSLIIDKKIEEANDYIAELNDYKTGITS